MLHPSPPAAMLPGPAPGPCDRAARAAVLADPRADDRRRRLELTPSRILIDRRVGAVSMRLALAPSAFRGVALKVVEREGALAYEVALVHRDAELDATLALCETLPEARAEWRQWARWFALSPLIERERGAYVAPDEVGSQRPRPRRRRRVLAGRRSRFALRRRLGEPARMAVSHRGEREIACHE